MLSSQWSKEKTKALELKHTKEQSHVCRLTRPESKHQERNPLSSLLRGRVGRLSRRFQKDRGAEQRWRTSALDGTE